MVILKKNFCNLNDKDLLLLQKYIDFIIIQFCKYNYISHTLFLEFLNKNENVYISFLLLLLPFYNKKVNNIYSLNDLYFNSLYTNKYIELNKNSKLNVEDILKYNTDSLVNTIRICSNKFYVNGLEIIPIYLHNYKNTQLYLDTLYKINQNKLHEIDTGLSNDDIFNTIFNDLYFNIIKIEWILDTNFSKKKAIDYANKYFPHYHFFSEIKEKDWNLYLDEVNSIYDHCWYSKDFLHKNNNISNLQLYHFCKKFTNSSKNKKIWFSLTENEKNNFIFKFYNIQPEIKNIITDIIFESLIIKGTLSTFTFSSQNNKNKKFEDSYFFLTGKNHPVLLNSFYTMNWISQLNFFHHYIHHRIILLTGGTGVGKSTQAPILLMYSDIMIYYDLYSQIVCSVPRKNAVENNAVRIFSSLKLSKNSHFNIQFQHSENNYLFPFKYSKTNLKIVTDEILKNILKENLFCIKKGNVTINHIIIDESHEHKINMDFILTILKHSLFLYNKHTKLFIISATMDEDDLNYRTFFKSVLDKDIYFTNYHPYPEYLDRRLHISEYKKLNNFFITEYYNDKIINDYESAEKKAIELIKSISFSTKKGTILGFSIGIKEIESMIIALNQIIPSNTIAVPLYSKYSLSYRNAVSSPQFLDEWHYDKKYVLDILNNFQESWNTLKLPFPKKKYNRYIIIGTNIVEASLTINSLKYVVDTGYEKVAIYDHDLKKEILHIKPISESSRIQRKGRVGRVSDGFVYYTYKKNERKNNKIQKEIQNQDISSYLFDIIGFNKINISELDNEIDLQLGKKQVFIDGFSIEDICKPKFFIIQPTLNIYNFFYEHKKHFLWKSLFNYSFYTKIQNLKLLFKSKYLNNYEAVIILQAYYLFNRNDFISFFEKYIIDKYQQKDMKLLLSFLENKTIYSYYYQITKHNIHLYLLN